jgi:hypothetical protein
MGDSHKKSGGEEGEQLTSLLDLVEQYMRRDLQLQVDIAHAVGSKCSSHKRAAYTHTYTHNTHPECACYAAPRFLLELLEPSN